MSDSLVDQFKYAPFGIIPRVELALDPGASVIAHGHALLEKDPEISINYKIFNPRERGLTKTRLAFRFARKAFSGQAVSDVFQNTASEPRTIKFHSQHGGSVVWIDTNEFGPIVCAKKHFMAALDPNVHIDLKKINAGFMRRNFTGEEEGILQRIEVSKDGDPHIFLGGHTMAAMEVLKPGEQRHLHHRSLLAATDTVDIGLHKIPGFGNRRMASEGSFLTTVTGPGTIWLNTLNTPSIPGHGHHASATTGLSLVVHALGG